MRRSVLLLFYICQVLFVFGQEEVITLIDSAESVVEEPKYEYWKAGYYNNIKKVESLNTISTQDFAKMLNKYESKDFEYVESISDKLSVWSSIREWLGKFFDDLLPDVNLNPSEWFYNLLGILGALLVVYLLYKLFFSGKQFIFNPKEEIGEDEATVEYVEKNLLETDINSYIKRAIDAKDYPLAIRYQHLLNIQLLAKKNVIHWNQSKTNLELMDEIQNDELKSEFQKCTLLFDYVWFGDFAISETKFQEIANSFEAFQRRWT